MTQLLRRSGYYGLGPALFFTTCGILVLFLFAWKFGFFLGVGAEDERFGVKFNQDRVKRGVPVLPSDWVPDRPSLELRYRPHTGVRVVETNVGQQIWKNPVSDENADVGHFAKEVGFSLSGPSSESDRYRFFYEEAEYILRCNYDFKAATAEAWTFDLIMSKGDLWDARELSRAEADSVCNAWRKRDAKAECPPAFLNGK